MVRKSSGIAGGVRQMTALHYRNDPGHAYRRLEQLQGVVQSLYKHASDDPLLFAYQLKEQLPLIATAVLDIEKWSVAVIDATPDQIVDSGVK